MIGRFRRLPLKLMYRGLELSSESEQLLDEAMVRLDVDDPDEAVKTALRAFLEQKRAQEETT